MTDIDYADLTRRLRGRAAFFDAKYTETDQQKTAALFNQAATAIDTLLLSLAEADALMLTFEDRIVSCEPTGTWGKWRHRAISFIAAARERVRARQEQKR